MEKLLKKDSLPLLLLAVCFGFLCMMPLVDLVVQGLSPHKELAAWIILAVLVLIVLNKTIRQGIMDITNVVVRLHEQKLRQERLGPNERLVDVTGGPSWDTAQTNQGMFDSMAQYEQSAVQQTYGVYRGESW